MDERAGLATGAVHRQRVADRGLHQEAVEHGAVVTVVVEAVDQTLVALGLGGVGAPDDALVQVGDPEPVVLHVVGEEQLVEGLGHVVDRARIRRVEDLLLDRLAAVLARDLDVQVALGDLHPGGAVAVHTHRAEVDDVDVQPGLHHRGEQVVGGVHVVVDRVALVPGVLHGVRGGTLLGEVHHRVGPLELEQGQQAVVVLGQVDVAEPDLLARHLTPGRQSVLDRGDRGERLGPQLLVDRAAGQVVDDDDLIAPVGQVQCGRPATETVAAEDQNFHNASRCTPATDPPAARPTITHGPRRSAPSWPARAATLRDRMRGTPDATKEEEADDGRTQGPTARGHEGRHEGP
ncbi:hypothetical protein SDC9_74351 [bioreactor metagenome]|uniref:Uncharacterized protein n=1 Tax=bioreactor metagenome TaxID=1076179 RepID=A0A644YHT2_9ZZZZ